MRINKFNAKFLARAGIIAALYVVLTYLAGVMNLAYGPVQFRFSEALTVLPFLFPEAVPGADLTCLNGRVFRVKSGNVPFLSLFPDFSPEEWFGSGVNGEKK